MNVGITQEQADAYIADLNAISLKHGIFIFGRETELDRIGIRYVAVLEGDVFEVNHDFIESEVSQ